MQVEEGGTSMVYYDKDADMKYLAGRTVSVIGYGNQGRAQALNLRDSGVSVVVGCMPDSYRDRALHDGFTVFEIGEAVRRSEIILFLIPDEVQKSVYTQSVEPHLKAGMTLCFGSGYNVHYGHIKPWDQVDVILLAPRTIGVLVRDSFVAGEGVPADIAIHHDHSGNAWQTVLALSKAVGCTRSGVFKSTFAEETELDLFSEQGFWPIILECIINAFELLTERGYSREAVLLELYASGETADIFREMATQGMFEQMRFHSLTSQYGALSRRKHVNSSEIRRGMEAVLDGIRDGSFAREWAEDAPRGYPRFLELRQQALAHPLNEADRALRTLVKRGETGHQ
jgi:ketol-acid reductoisomerase